MSTATQELVAICEALPESQQAEVADFARFLLERLHEERWEAIISDPKPLSKFSSFVRESAKEAAEPLDPQRL